ncbi:MAG: hypothetical protein M3O70_16250, partial [Actinomycetota bacterium]|nr:hypothetical protein [Actinomycetota bacterium]
ARQLARGVPRRLPVARNQTRLPLGPALLVGLRRTHRLHPFREIRRLHLELYLRQLEPSAPRPANATL